MIRPLFQFSRSVAATHVGDGGARTFGLILFFAALLTMVATTAPTRAAPLLFEDERGVLTIAPLLEKVTPGVVNISVRTRAVAEANPLFNDPFFRRFFDRPSRPQYRESMSAGSGVIVDASQGFVLTNNHVIANAQAILVTLKDGRRLEAELVGADPATDIALLRIEPGNLTALSFGDSDSVRVGDVVIAIGNPFGIGQTVTSGIVSALGRGGLGIEGYEDFIQTDASINPGNSGGALIDTRGRLIGINTAIIGPSGGNVGIGFAVPSHMARAVMDQLVRFGRVRRGRLGVTIQDLTPEIAEAMGMATARGAIITGVQQGGPADKAGVKAGDLVIGVDGRPLRNSTDLRNRIGLVPAGETITLDVLRDGKSFSIRTRVIDPDVLSEDDEPVIPEFAGARFVDPDRGVGAFQTTGILVASVRRDSAAWRLGLRQGDLIVAVNRHAVARMSEFVEAVSSSRGMLALNLVRDDEEAILVIRR